MNEINNKSTFITVISWILIVISGFGTLMTFMQNIMFFLMGDFFSPIEQDHGFFLNNIKLIFPLFFLLVAYSFVSAIGLLKRKNWARKSYIVLFGIGVLYFIGVLIFFWTGDSFRSNIGSAQNEFDIMFNIMKIFYTVLLLGLSTAFGWLIKKLLSEKVINEFKHAS